MRRTKQQLSIHSQEIGDLRAERSNPAALEIAGGGPSRAERGIAGHIQVSASQLQAKTGKMPVLLEITAIRHKSLYRLALDVIFQLRGAWVCHCEE